MNAGNQSQPGLRRALPPWQIVLLAISGIIGVTIFSTIGTVLHTASTAGTLIALGLVAFVTICVMASIGELVILWPVPNALVEYVKYFVDADLATVVGVTYWYTWSSIFTGLLIAAFDFFCEFLERPMYRVGVLIAIGFVLIIINGLGVKLYGWVEGVGGVLKFLNAVAGGIFLCFALAKQQAANNLAFGYNKTEAKSPVVAICMSLPVLAYGFLGVEIIAITAFEAQNRRALRLPIRFIAWIMAAIYILVAVPGTILVKWHDQYLLGLVPTQNNATLSRRAEPPSLPSQCPQTYPYVVLAAFEFGSEATAKYFNACIIYFCISSANTALYVASRTLYGLFRPLVERRPQNLSWWQQPLDLPFYLGMVSSRGVPVAALVVSAVSWVWLIALRAVKLDVLEIAINVGSVGGVMVWLVECFAYIKYFAWLRQTDLPDPYDRTSRTYQWQRHRPFFSSLQPFVAWGGGVGCIAIGLVLCSAFWWQSEITAVKVISAYGGPFAMCVLFVLLKIWRCLDKSGATPARGRAIFQELEDLSGLPLDREPRASDDDEQRVSGRTLQKIGQLFRYRANSKQPAHTVVNEVGPDATGFQLNGMHNADPQRGIVRQRTNESVNGGPLTVTG